MTRYEKLLIEAEKQTVIVLELDLGTNKKCGKYISNKEKNIIIINSNMTEIDKYEVLAEELGHHHTTFGHITNQKDIRNKKLELIARKDSFKILVEPNDVVEAMRYGVTTIYEMAEYLNITIDTLLNILNEWKKQYGMGIFVGNYYLQLEPSFGIIRDFGGLFNYNNF
ncbi:ImmA/IrrE family metallo-endopeptidase [Clostridium cavendishii]|uniref:ImmA/IrrE family metallo-endopeptidase n=1 Tax=Clostridium cavendishii TaxID=349931 RepID=UPI0009351AE1|nr:ImmA/IrrE family metallo-endopeptidase [Clostridium cavendishii]